MPRLYLPLLKPTGPIHITGEKAKYLTRVLRSKVGDEIVLFDGKGSSYEASIKSIAKNDIVAEIVKAVRTDTEPKVRIVFVQGLLKGEKMDLVIQKATELGVAEIIPAITERSQVRHTGKLLRWKKIAEDASRQCGRNVIPLIHEPVNLDSWLSSRSSSPVNGIMFWEEETSPLKEVMTKIAFAPVHDSNLLLYLMTGPEGGFSRKEAEAAGACGFLVASMGKRILRAETAAISSIAIVQFMLGDMG